jgi:hypothetical protein
MALAVAAVGVRLVVMAELLVLLTIVAVLAAARLSTLTVSQLLGYLATQLVCMEQYHDFLH